MGIYPCGKCKECDNELTFYSFNGSTISHAEDCSTMKNTKLNLRKGSHKD